MSEARKIQAKSERDYVRMRKHIWLGQNANVSQLTVAMKELVDNEIDVCNERSQPATAAIIKISPNRIAVMDNGAGISTDIADPKVGKTHLELAVGKLFTSSNFDGTDDSIGSNGLGSSLANMTSARFAALNFNQNKRQKTVRGYEYRNGYLIGSDEDIHIMSDILDNIRAPRTKTVTPEYIYNELLVDLEYLDSNNMNHSSKRKIKEKFLKLILHMVIELKIHIVERKRMKNSLSWSLKMKDIM